MLIVGYCFGIRSERRLREEVHLNLGYRWFCRLGLDGAVPDHSTFSKNRHGRLRESDLLRKVFETTVQRCIDERLVGGEGFAVDASMIKARTRRAGAAPGFCLAQSARRFGPTATACLNRQARYVAAALAPRPLKSESGEGEVKLTSRWLPYDKSTGVWMVIRKKMTSVDAHVGARVREHRISLGLTQRELGEMVGATSQAIYKYERGIDRLSAGQLYEIASALNQPVTDFYEGLGKEAPQRFVVHRRRALEIARYFTEIPSEKHQQAFGALVRLLAGR